jgi:hypothetical protein
LPYTKWGRPIRPLSVQIWPIFAHLMVRPESTDMNKTRGNADYLRASLGLSASPIVGLQAGVSGGALP